jgi:hypothetical protein
MQTPHYIDLPERAEVRTRRPSRLRHGYAGDPDAGLRAVRYLLICTQLSNNHYYGSLVRSLWLRQSLAWFAVYTLVVSDWLLPSGAGGPNSWVEESIEHGGLT